MKKNVYVVGGVLALLGVASIAYVLRPPAEASAPIEAVPVVADQPTEQIAAGAEEEPTAVVENPAEGMTEEEAPPGDPPTEEEVFEDPSGVVIFTIVQEESEVRFSIDELLRGQPVTAVGISNQVAAEIAVDFDAPANSTVGEVLVNARTLETDRSNRDRMIRNEILDTAEFEFITFVPTSIVGLPDVINVGETITFQVIGDLTIRDFTHEETFDVTLLVVSPDRLEGFATATIQRANYDLKIPSVPSVADVSEDVILEIDLVAVSK